MINAPQIIFMADSHNHPTSTAALIKALPFLISKGFDTLCFEEPSEPKISMEKRIQISDFDYKLKKAIEDKDVNYIELIEKAYGKDIVEAEKSIATHSSTHLARKKLLEKVKLVGIKFIPIDVIEPTKVETNPRNQHMLEEVKSAIIASKTKKIIIFAGYGHIGNHFGGGLQRSTVYNRGLASLLNSNASFYFAFFSDEDSKRIKEIQEYAPLININLIRFVKILNNDYDPFIDQLKSDIGQPTPPVNPSISNLQTYYTTLYSGISGCQTMNKGTFSYIEDLGGEILPKQYKLTLQVTAQSFKIDSALLTKPVRDKLNIDRVFIPNTYRSCLDRIREIPTCIIEEARNKKGKDGYYLTFIKSDNARPTIQEIMREHDQEMKERETTSKNALIEMNKSSLATHRNVNTSAHTTAAPGEILEKPSRGEAQQTDTIHP